MKNIKYLNMIKYNSNKFIPNKNNIKNFNNKFFINKKNKYRLQVDKFILPHSNTLRDYLSSLNKEK